MDTKQASEEFKKVLANAEADRKEEFERALAKQCAAIDFVARPEFILTGSRRFGYSRVYSDLDVFIVETDMRKYEDEARQLGFRVRELSNKKYKDESVQFILTYQGVVDIQVIKTEWFEAKKKAQLLFEKTLVKDADGKVLPPAYSKDTLRRIWNYLMTQTSFPWSDSPIHNSGVVRHDMESPTLEILKDFLSKRGVS